MKIFTDEFKDQASLTVGIIALICFAAFLLGGIGWQLGCDSTWEAAGRNGLAIHNPTNDLCSWQCTWSKDEINEGDKCPWCRKGKLYLPAIPKGQTK